MQLLRSLTMLIHKLTAPESTALVPVRIPNGKWQKVVSGSDIVRSYLYICACGQHQELTSAEAKSREVRKCGCRKPYNLLRDLALAPESSISDYENALANLPERSLAVRAQQPPYKVVEVGNENVRVEWGGPRDDARTAAFASSDPEMMGPGFSFPKR
jgi:hypothetical protein